MRNNIFVDVDGVLYYTWEYLDDILMKEFGKGLSSEEWVLSCFYGLDLKDPKQKFADDILRSEEFYINQPVREDAVEYLPKIYSFCEVIYLTSRIIKDYEWNRKLLLRHFPVKKLIIVEKTSEKRNYMIKGSVMIDDSPIVMLNLPQNVYGFFFTNRWNLQAHIANGRKIKRVRDWRTVYEILRIWSGKK